MLKVSKLGATALALALSVTFLTPSTALAASKPSATVNLDKVGTNTLRVDEDVKSIFTQSGERDAVEAAVVKAGIAGGWLSATEVGEFENPIYLYDGEGYSTYYYKDGYQFNFKDLDTYSDDTDNVKYTVTQRVYINPTTGKTSVKEDDVYVNDEAAMQKFVSGIRIAAGETTYLSVPLINGDINITNVKSSKKKILKAKRFEKKDVVLTSNANVIVKSEVVGGKTVHYFYTSAGEKVVLADDYTKDPKYLAATRSNAVVYIKLTPVKTGSSKLSFDIVNEQGTVTGKVETTVYVVSDQDMLKTFTFAGKSLLDDYSNPKNFWYGKKSSDTDYNVSSANSGKLVVKANKKYKVVEIKVGTIGLTPYTSEIAAKEGHGNYGYTYSNISGNAVDAGIDLNGDGDTDDIIDGVSESNARYKFTTVKSGKKIKLSKVGVDQSYSYEVNSRTRDNGKDIYAKNVAGNAVSEKFTNKGYALVAPTVIKVVVYDTLAQEYHTIEKTIYRTVKK
ncbi:hypothetical protein [Butyrivibrio sp. WCE2006]|uniref:hypothetical protein n=1 Tax=Butyrivibrio sp. WCE2006 TaxID=1410611 RepID=UPI0005D2AC11|nr:hypothetical protein [Butyrivibrio sp. WCE2006]